MEPYITIVLYFILFHKLKIYIYIYIIHIQPLHRRYIFNFWYVSFFTKERSAKGKLTIQENNKEHSLKELTLQDDRRPSSESGVAGTIRALAGTNKKDDHDLELKLKNPDQKNQHSNDAHVGLP